MKKLFTTLLTGALLTASAAAYAISPGHYVNRYYAAADGYTAVYGEIKLCRLEGFAKLPKIEVFSLITRDGMEPMECYAGIINQNGPARATGTLMFKLTNKERVEIVGRTPQKGTWLADIRSTENNIRFDLRGDGKIGFRAIDGKQLPISSEASYEYLGPQIQDQGIAVMKIVALAKVRSLLGEKMKVRDQSYKLDFTQGANELLKVQEKGKEKTYLVYDNLQRITEIKNAGGEYKELLVGTAAGN